MARQNTPFENIEGALEYVTCLLDACRIAQSQVEKEISPLQPVRPTRKLDALKLVDFKLEKLPRTSPKANACSRICAGFDELFLTSATVWREQPLVPDNLFGVVRWSTLFGHPNTLGT